MGHSERCHAKLSLSSVPSYCRHKASGQAYVDLGAGEVYLGTYGSAASRAEYNRLVGEWLANGRQAAAAQASISIVEIINVFWKRCQSYYRRAAGRGLLYEGYGPEHAG